MAANTFLVFVSIYQYCANVFIFFSKYMLELLKCIAQTNSLTIPEPIAFKIIPIALIEILFYFR